MAAKLIPKDKYPNIASVAVTLSAANTLTFEPLQSGVSIFERIAWEIYAIEYTFSAGNLDLLTATEDYVQWGISRSDVASVIAFKDPALIDFNRIQQFFQGFTPAVSHLLSSPIVRSFVREYGSPMIVLPNPLYIWATSVGLASAISVTARIIYRSITLTPSDYVELLEASRIVG